MKKALLTIFFFTLPFSLFALDKEGGIIGTGVIGQITDLEQFEVSGMRFQTDQDIAFEGISNFDDLAMGMTLAMRAERDGDSWRATEIRRVSVLVGPVTGASEVMGVPIIGEVPDGGWARIDGFWSEAGVVATRVEAIEDGEHSAIGPIDQLARMGALIAADNDDLSDMEGEIVVIRGRYANQRFVVNSVKPGLFRGDEPNLLLAEGFLSQAGTSGEYRMVGVGTRSAAQLSEPVDPARKTIRCALDGRMDFELDQAVAQARETILSLCANFPR